MPAIRALSIIPGESCFSIQGQGEVSVDHWTEGEDAMKSIVQRGFFLCVILTGLFFWLWPASLYAQSIGGTCTTTGQITMTGKNPGYILVCNGSNWLLADQFNSNGQIGINQQTPEAELDVNGGLRVGTDTTCNSSSNAGEIIYNSTTKLMQFCNGIAWTSFPSAGTSAPSASCGSTSGTFSSGTSPSSAPENTTVTVLGGCTVTFKAWGGGGGTGGSGAEFSVGQITSPGGGGGFASITETVPVTTTFYISIGGGGMSGPNDETACDNAAGVNGAPGGAGGSGFPGYTGGNGGTSTCYQSDGSGGGGGGGAGATLIWTGSYGGTLVLAAGGGGGGGGADFHGDAPGSPGYASGNGAQESAGTTAGATGSNALSGSYGLGSGGGGGAGYNTGGTGGTGGASAGGADNAGTGGAGGASYAVSPGSSSQGSGSTPGGSGDPNYPTNAGVGGNTGSTSPQAGYPGAVYYSW